MYEAFYHLRAKPFQLSPDPSFFYGSKGHKRAMSYLEYGLHQGEGFIVITGEVGAGKTTLVRHLFKKLQGENLVAAQLVSTQLEADDMLRMVDGMLMEGGHVALGEEVVVVASMPVHADGTTNFLKLHRVGESRSY